MRLGTGLISRPVNRRRSGISLARWCWWGACARPFYPTRQKSKFLLCKRARIFLLFSDSERIFL